MSETDWRPLPEDVTTHTMGAFFQHGPDRFCMYHARLGVWTFGGTKECLRDGHPDTWLRTTPAPQARAGESEGAGS